MRLKQKLRKLHWQRSLELRLKTLYLSHDNFLQEPKTFRTSLVDSKFRGNMKNGVILSLNYDNGKEKWVSMLRESFTFYIEQESPHSTLKIIIVERPKHYFFTTNKGCREIERNKMYKILE